MTAAQTAKRAAEPPSRNRKLPAQTSVLARAMGADFQRLRPELRERFGFTSADAVGCIGTGVMTRIWRTSSIATPFLHLGATRHILFPEQGEQVPFTVENYAYRDGYGRETLTVVRTFELGPHLRRRFDATLVYSASRGGVVDFLGTHQHFAVDLRPWADRHGGLWMRTGAQRYGRRRFPVALSGAARLHEWWDEREQCFHIDVRVTNPYLGVLFAYRGRFTVTYVDTGTAPIPAAVQPLRENPAM
jgi:hypothetical protein